MAEVGDFSVKAVGRGQSPVVSVLRYPGKPDISVALVDEQGSIKDTEDCHSFP